MKITRVEQQRNDYQLDQARLEKQRTNDYAKKIEDRRFEQIIAERVARNLRLDLDKGRNIDIEC
jgi:hypothetical protein